MTGVVDLTDSTGGYGAVTDNMQEFLTLFPERFRRELDVAVEESRAGATPFNLEGLVEIIADLGRRAEARFYQGSVILGTEPVSAEEIQQIVEGLSGIGKDNRAGIEATLHRISVIRSRQGRVIGITARVGRAVYGSAEVLRDVFTSGQSVLLLGSPGVGKTTLLREISRVLADEYHKRVVIVDTSNEIAGDGDIPHPGIGRARRMPVPEPALQHAVMVEAVENHMPEVVVIDEIGTEAEAYAARTIAERGVTLVATAHGLKLENLLMNPTLSDLVGGIQSVTLSDEEAKRRKCRKSVLERKAPPTFGVIVEIRERNLFAVHRDVEKVVDNSLLGLVCEPELRRRLEDGTLQVTRAADTPSALGAKRRAKDKPCAGGVSVGKKGDDYEIYQDGDDAACGEDFESAEECAGAESEVFGECSTWEDNPEALGLFGTRTTKRHDIYKLNDDDEEYLTIPEHPDDVVDLSRTVKIYPYAISCRRLQRLLDNFSIDAKLVNEWHKGDIVLTLRNAIKRKDSFFNAIKKNNIPVHCVEANNIQSIKAFLENFFHVSGISDGEVARRDVERGIEEVKRTGHPVDLAPQGMKWRRYQVVTAERAGIFAACFGPEPSRYVRLSLE